MDTDIYSYLRAKFWFYYGTFLGMIVVQIFYVIVFVCMSGLLFVFFLVIPLKYPVLSPLYLLYAVWLWFDWDTPSTGGRAIQYCYSRRWKIFNVVQKYYPITLIKTADLEPEKNYIFGYHPHGMIPEGALVSFGTEFAGFTSLFPGIHPRLTTVSFFNWVFMYRELALALGIISVSRDSLEYQLTQKGPGHSVVIVIGGASEVLNTTPSSYYLTLNKRKGFVRLALETGSSLVPVFAFGQNDLFRQPRTIFPPRIESWLSKWPKVIAKYSLLAYHDMPTFGITPRPNPIHVVVGAPIHVTRVPHPTQKEVDDLQGVYTARLTEIFDTHKEMYGVDKDIRLILDPKSN